MAENFLGVRTWGGVLTGHPPSMCVPGEILEGVGVPSAGNTARTSAELLLSNFS